MQITSFFFLLKGHTFLPEGIHIATGQLLYAGQGGGCGQVQCIHLFIVF